VLGAGVLLVLSHGTATLRGKPPRQGSAGRAFLPLRESPPPLGDGGL